MTRRLLRAALVAAFLLPAAVLPATAQTPCDGDRSLELFVLPPAATGVNYVFSYDAQEHGLLSHYTLRLYRADEDAEATGPALSTQTVTPAATTVIGLMQDDPTETCYSLPVVPVAQIPRGVPIVATLSATSDVEALSSLESEPSDPLGLRLGAPAIRARP